MVADGIKVADQLMCPWEITLDYPVDLLSSEESWQVVKGGRKWELEIWIFQASTFEEGGKKHQSRKAGSLKKLAKARDCILL